MNYFVKRPEIDTYTVFTSQGPVLEVTRTYGEDQVSIDRIPMFALPKPRKRARPVIACDPHWHG